MKVSRLVTHSGLTIDISLVKCIKHGTTYDGPKRHVLTFEFQTRFIYIQNPATEEYELQAVQDSTELDFPSFERLETAADEWEAIWQDYLDDHGS